MCTIVTRCCSRDVKECINLPPFRRGYYACECRPTESKKQILPHPDVLGFYVLICPFWILGCWNLYISYILFIEKLLFDKLVTLGYILLPQIRICINDWIRCYLWLKFIVSWWRHEMETFSALLAICAGNSPVTGEFPAQRPVTRTFDVIFDLRVNGRLSQSWGWWFVTSSRLLWRHSNVLPCPNFNTSGPFY